VTAWAAGATGTLVAVAYAGGRLQLREIDKDSPAHRWDASDLAGTPQTMPVVAEVVGVARYRRANRESASPK